MLKLTDATVVFEGARHPALDRVSLHIPPASWTAIVGANGSGKSTLLSVLAGLLPLRSGSLERDGEREGTPRIALLQQDPDNQLVATSVRHELALSVPAGVTAEERAARIAEAIPRFDLSHLLERNPHRVSGGEKQRLACATVWLERPDVVLLDEPLAFLDADARARVIDFVREAHAGGAAIVWATPGEDAGLARDVIHLERGRVVARAPDVTAVNAGSLPRRVRAPGEMVLSLAGTSFAYGDRVVLDSIDLAVAKGECVGIVGRNGSGKSTLLTLAGGALAPASGRIVRANDGPALYLPQTPERMFFAETVREEIAFGIKRLRQYRGAGEEPIAAIVRESVQAVGLDPDDMIERSPFQLSGGEMRRVAFAIAHAMAPALLLLDEPASGLDRAGRDVLASLLTARLDHGGAAVLASHDPNHLAGLCDRVLGLESGRLVPV